MVRQAEAPAAPPEDTGGPQIGESRWPPVCAMLVFLAITIALRVWLPEEGLVRAPWLFPALEAILLVVLLTSTPDTLAERRRLHRLALLIVWLLVAAALWSTALLVYDLVEGKGVSNNADELLATGGVVWLGNNLSFALLYWMIDSGGPIARTRNPHPVDFAFTQHLNPGLSPPGWTPVFLDYLHLGFTNATAFSPTDVMPLSHRAKYAMVLQATVALILIGLIVARAVNAFT
jgi:hypothetical protein